MGKKPFWLAGVVCALILGVAREGWARPLLILHTNDLHSHFEHSMDPSQGGYAQLKATIDRLRDEAAQSGIESILLDAGDFSEGTELFFAEHGDYSWRLLDAIGYDAAVFGNHDYLMGQKELNDLLGRVRPQFAIMGANFTMPWYELAEYKNLTKYIKPYSEFSRAGLKIGVLGLANDEFEYRWLVGPLTMDEPFEGVDRWLPEVRSRNDVVIALTHIGTAMDRELARTYSGIDAVVGGHWHEYVETPYMETNPDGVQVPVVQAGDHGRAVGRFLVDVEPGLPLKVLDYQLVRVPSAGPKDPAVDSMVKEARKALEDEYGKDYLAEIVGASDVPLVRPTEHRTEWGQVVADALQESAGAEMAVDSADLFGDDQPPGAVSREDLLLFYPRMFSLEERKGWNVWTTKAYGWVLKFALEQAYRQHVKFVFSSNFTFDVSGPSGKEKLSNLRLNGKPFNPLHSYKVALPEGIGRAIDEISDLFKLVFRSPKDTGTPVWQAIEHKLREIGVVKPGYGGDATRSSTMPMPSTRPGASPADC